MEIVLITYFDDEFGEADFDSTPVSIDGFIAFLSRPDRPDYFSFFIDDDMFIVESGILTTKVENTFVSELITKGLLKL